MYHEIVPCVTEDPKAKHKWIHMFRLGCSFEDNNDYNVCNINRRHEKLDCTGLLQQELQAELVAKSKQKDQ